MAIIAVLVAVLLPAMQLARAKTRDVICISQLRQIYTAFTAYLQDSDGIVFWRGYNLALDGMDWYVYRGRETGNAHTGQGGLFNNTIPRPLNPHLSNKFEVFRCPEDSRPWSWAPWAGNHTHYDLVGNSYNFNANGYPIGSSSLGALGTGFAGRQFGMTEDPSRTILFLGASVIKMLMYMAPDGWHRGASNVCLADGHVLFMNPFDIPYYTWDP